MKNVFGVIKWVIIVIVFIVVSMYIDETLLFLGKIPVIGYLFKWIYFLRMNAI